MANPENFYKNQLEKLQTTLEKEKRLLTKISFARLLVFLAIGFLAYILFDKPFGFWTVIGVGSVGFLGLLRWHTDIKTSFNLHKTLKEINEEEIAILNGKYHDRPDGSEYEENTHFYSSDIDLFGKGSFFQYLNRTGLKEGGQYLSKMLKSNDILNIEKKQVAIQELSTFPEWRQRYTAKGRLTKTETPAHVISTWLKKYAPYISEKTYKLPALFSMVTLLIVAITAFKLVDFWVLGLWFLLGLAITGRYLKKNNVLNAKTSKVKDTIQQYSLLLEEIEQQAFNSELLNAEKQKIQSSSMEASKIFQQFSGAMDRFDSRNNILVALLANGFFLWDLQCALKIEQWIVKYKDLVEQWFTTIAFFDAYNSLATLDFNHPEFSYPTITNDSEALIEAKSLGHPLITEAKRIPSDLDILKLDFFVVTGANMAGKSTFLRTVSLYVLMSNLGLPVCAQSSRYSPIKLITSMRTSDSLADQSSYFFAELTRLQYIREQLEQDDYLVILDEILKGTNSVDKAAGSKKLIESLVGQGITGIIATHDLSLCSIAEEKEAVKNYFFETEIKSDELHFDYQLKKGVCKNMNASFLLKKMKIV